MRFYVRSARMEADEIPVAVGAGAIGLSAVAALAARGIAPIIVSDYDAERRELAYASFGRTSPSTLPNSRPSTCGARCASNVAYGVRWSSSNAWARQD
jgi:Zn-dependent alcohol dehydrogenase